MAKIKANFVNILCKLARKQLTILKECANATSSLSTASVIITVHVSSLSIELDFV
jgi:hypothetical protein